MTEQPTAPRAPEEQAEIERGGKRWAIGIGLAIVAIVALCMINGNRKHERTSEEVSADAQRACQEKFIADRLKAPASAKYSGVAVSRAAGGIYTVTGAVDSENSFGALVRSSWTCTVHLDGETWKLDSAAVN